MNKSCYVNLKNDPDTKLTRYGARDYDPVIGRWLQRDPIKFQGGTTNLYEYCGNDSVNCIDPSGLAVIPFPIIWPILEPIVMPIIIGIGAICGNMSKNKNNNQSDRCLQLYKDDHNTCSALRGTAPQELQDKCWRNLVKRQSECKLNLPLSPLLL